MSSEYILVFFFFFFDNTEYILVKFLYGAVIGRRHKMCLTQLRSCISVVFLSAHILNCMTSCNASGL